MGLYDLPGAFRYISKVTNRKIHYIGHSQGTLSMFIALSEQVKLVSDNLLSYHAYGPVAYLIHQKSKLLASASKTFLPDILLVFIIRFREAMLNKHLSSIKMDIDFNRKCAL